ncbi:hypothetical protein V2J09_004584 [Rumex salicifolius]
MAFVFQLKDEHKCDGCARKIKKCMKKLKGVESAEVKKTRDENGNNEFTIIAKGSFNPEDIIQRVENKKKKRIELVSDSTNEKLNRVEPVETDVESLKNLKKLASNNLGKAQKLTDLANECETLKAQLYNAWRRQNELHKQKLDTILNRDLLPNATLQRRSRPGVTKKKDESEILYGNLGSKKMKLEDFVDKYKRLQLKKHTRINPLA